MNGNKKRQTNLRPRVNETLAAAYPTLFGRVLKPSAILHRLQRQSLRAVGDNQKKTIVSLEFNQRNDIYQWLRKLPAYVYRYFDRLEVESLAHLYAYIIRGETQRLMRDNELTAFFRDSFDVTSLVSLEGLRLGFCDGRRCHLHRFIQCFGILFHGSVEEQAHLVFRMCDSLDIGIIRRQTDLNYLFKDSFNPMIAARNVHLDPDEPVRDTIQFMGEQYSFQTSGSCGGITRESFAGRADKDPLYLDTLLAYMPESRYVATWAEFIGGDSKKISMVPKNYTYRHSSLAGKK